VSRWLGRLFRSPETGRLVIVQRPNAALVVYLAATAMRLVLRPEGAAGWATAAVGTAALAWWATDEVARGESPFRRVLGLAVLAGLVLRLLPG
jgi:hypothetical protein